MYCKLDRYLHREKLAVHIRKKTSIACEEVETVDRSVMVMVRINRMKRGCEKVLTIY